MKSCCVLQDHYDDEHDKIVFHKTIPNSQEQDQDRFFFWSQTGLVLRPTVSDHISAKNTPFPHTLYHADFNRSRSNRVRISIGGTKNWGALNWGPSKKPLRHVCYHAEFDRSS